MIYLDNNSTTRPHPKALKLVQELQQEPLNPSSIHSEGRRARFLIENARKQVAQLVCTDDLRKYQITFTASGTEANCMLIKSFQDAEIFISATEHLSIFAHKNASKNIKIIKVD